MLVQSIFHEQILVEKYESFIYFVAWSLKILEWTKKIPTMCRLMTVLSHPGHSKSKCYIVGN